jgi:hypothetical protein
VPSFPDSTLDRSLQCLRLFFFDFHFSAFVVALSATYFCFHSSPQSSSFLHNSFTIHQIINPSTLPALQLTRVSAFIRFVQPLADWSSVFLISVRSPR